jgi:aconitate hydratase
MGSNVTRKLLEAHRVEGSLEPGERIAIRVDQTLTQDATGTLVMLELEAMGLRRVKTELSVQYVDHNLLQEDFKNADDHLFLESACRRFGVHFSRPGNGVSHPVHMMRFGRPGATLLGSDSHTCAGGSLGMLAIGAGGSDVSACMAGEPFRLTMPAVWGVRLSGALPPWVSAKDVILEMLRRHGVRGGIGRIVEYHGPGLEGLTAMDRHVIANMGAELGATTTVFPSDAQTRAFLARCGREDAFTPLTADPDASYEIEEELDLGALEPLIALPSSPGNVVPVREVAGAPIYQAYVGSSANPGYRDFAVCAQMVEDRRIPPTVSFDINPSSREVLMALMRSGLLEALVAAGARLHQAGCNGCIGMGQAPATGRRSLRTVPRNFPGRSGTREDSVYLCSPETATASALEGRIVDPRTLGAPPPRVELPDVPGGSLSIAAPPPEREALGVALVKGPNIASIPELPPLPDAFTLPVILVVGDDVSTDEILPAGARALPFRSNIPKIAELCFDPIDPGYVQRAKGAGATGHVIVAGRNYGQGSSREHAALAPRYLGLRVVIAEGFARIHRDNLVRYGVLPLVLEDATKRVAEGARLVFEDLHAQLGRGPELELRAAGGARYLARHGLHPDELRYVLAGSAIHFLRDRGAATEVREVRLGAAQSDAHPTPP